MENVAWRRRNNPDTDGAVEVHRQFELAGLIKDSADNVVLKER